MDVSAIPARTNAGGWAALGRLPLGCERKGPAFVRSAEAGGGLFPQIAGVAEVRPSQKTGWFGRGEPGTRSITVQIQGTRLNQGEIPGATSPKLAGAPEVFLSLPRLSPILPPELGSPLGAALNNKRKSLSTVPPHWGKLGQIGKIFPTSFAHSSPGWLSKGRGCTWDPGLKRHRI